ncbi:glycosyltransferase 87 family protein [Corynebacterium sphenisci]|uniref:glycosyltransferase 87 family protein n=1 Tax=Corynebacterium sphenisci TaxID=191493 RepID=UPI000950D7B2|nr:glycosyltransferase 87 family protein [Corynebacterium sphenisci]
MLQDRIAALPPATRRRLLLLAGLLAAGVVALHLHRAFTYYMMDVEVFQDAGWALRRGQDLYSADFPTRSGFRFIYPPFAALLFWPTTWAGPTTLQVLWTAATIAAVWAILAMAATRLLLPRPRLAAAVLLGPALLVDPLRANIDFGQINVFLALLVVADVLGFLPRWARGAGVGVAAGIKITPAAYALIFLVRGRGGDVARSAGWFLLTAAVGFALRFEESVYYWTEEFFAGNRGGEPIYPPNQAVSGLVARAGVTGAAETAIVAAVFLAGAVAAGLAAWRLERIGRPVLALAAIALAVCVTGPYTVSHHWSIIIVGLPLLARLRSRPALALGIAFYLAHLIAPYGVFGEEGAVAANPLVWVIGNAQGIAGVVLLTALAWAAITGRVPELPRWRRARWSRAARTPDPAAG